MAISIGRLSGGNTPADGSDPRTFPAIWNATADTLEGLSNTVDGLEVGDLADATVTSPSFGQPLTYDPVSEQWVNDSGNYPVMVFADSTARSSAIPTPTEGMVTYVEDANRVEVYDGAAFGPIGGILQVVSTTKTDTFSTTSTSLTDLTGLSATVTPSSATSKIMVFATVLFGQGAQGATFTLTDGSNNELILPSVSKGSGNDGFLREYINQSDTMRNAGLAVLHSPSTTSAFTYKIRLRTTNSSGPLYVNRDVNNNVAGISTITVMEVAV